MTVETTFAVSGQHYLFNVQTFAHTVLALGGDAYAYALRDRTTQGVIDDVAGGKSDLGVLFQTSATADEVNAALDAAGLEFVELIQSAPRVALPKSHPMVNASSLSLEDMEDFPYLYFEQDEDSPVAFAEEALASVPRAKSIACTDRASLSELIVALNGYTVTSGILVGISDGAGLNTVPLDTDVKLHLGYVVRKGERFDRGLREPLLMLGYGGYSRRLHVDFRENASALFVPVVACEDRSAHRMQIRIVLSPVVDRGEFRIVRIEHRIQAFHHVQEQLFFRCEIVVQRRFGDADGGTYLVHGCLVVAFFGYQGVHGAHYLVSSARFAHSSSLSSKGAGTTIAYT